MNGAYRVCLVMVLYALALGTTGSLAANHVITWDLSSDVNSWAKGKTFKVGDQLVFKYSPGLHTVVELSTEKEYKNCDIGNALDSKSSGSDEFKLTKAGTRYFACGGHCDKGMKVQIKSAGTDSSSPSDDDKDSSTSTPSSTSSPSSTTSATSAAGVQSVAYLLLIFALVSTMSLFYVV